MLVLVTASPALSEPFAAGTTGAFDGAYVGAHLGASFADRDFTVDKGGYAITGFEGRDNDAGFAASGFAGYGLTINSIYLGGEVEFGGRNHDERSDRFEDSFVDFFGEELLRTGIDHDVEETGAVRARLGYDAGSFMPYLSGGLAFGKVDTRIFGKVDETINGVTTRIFEFDATDDGYDVGYTLGAGIEVPVFDRVFLRGDYAFTDLGTRTVIVEDLAGNELVKADFDTQLHDARIGIGYRF